jgi:RHS repeat-associated protein
LATTWSYLANSGDRRLAGISHVGLSAGNVSTWQFSSTPEDFITGVTETSDAPAVYPSPSQQTAAYNGLNQLTSLSAQTALTYSATGNLLSDGQRVFAWDAEDRLVGITWPAQPGKQVTFAYDGQGRRTTISSTPAGGGGTTTTSYVWCGASLCQVRNAANAVTRAYYDEGEFVPGAPAQRLYYGADQIGSVRRVFASTGSAPAYAYDPYGVALQGTAPLTDFGFAGMFWHADSGLYLTQYRAYDPTLGRWLSRDPMGEGSDPQANRYAYVGGNPIRYSDPSGLFYPRGGVDALANLLGMKPPQPETGQCRGPAKGFPPFVYPSTGKEEKKEEKPSLLDEKGKKHILEGDKTGGGHRSGTGKPGKSEFPAGWSDDKIKGEISDVATDPASTRTPADKGRTVVRGTRDGIDITVIVEPDGRIVTGYPTNVPRNPP